MREKHESANPNAMDRSNIRRPIPKSNRMLAPQASFQKKINCPTLAGTIFNGHSLPRGNFRLQNLVKLQFIIVSLSKEKYFKILVLTFH